MHDIKWWEVRVGGLTNDVVERDDRADSAPFTIVKVHFLDLFRGDVGQMVRFLNPNVMKLMMGSQYQNFSRKLTHKAHVFLIIITFSAIRQDSRRWKMNFNPRLWCNKTCRTLPLSSERKGVRIPHVYYKSINVNVLSKRRTMRCYVSTLLFFNLTTLSFQTNGSFSMSPHYYLFFSNNGSKIRGLIPSTCKHPCLLNFFFKKTF